MLAIAHFAVELDEDLEGTCVHCPRLANEHATIGPKVECATVKVATLKAIRQVDVSNKLRVPMHVVPGKLENNVGSVSGGNLTRPIDCLQDRSFGGSFRCWRVRKPLFGSQAPNTDQCLCQKSHNIPRLGPCIP